MRLFMIAVALAAGVPVTAQSQQPSIQTPVPRPDDLDALLNILLPEEATLKLGGQGVDSGIQEAEENDANLRALYDANPGMREFVGKKLRAEYIVTLRRELPSLRRTVSGILSSDLSPADLAKVLAFFSSPTGRKLLALSLQSVGSDPAPGAEEQQAAATAAVMKSLTPEDMPALMAFGSSPAAAKMNTVNPKIAQAGTAWAEDMIERNKERFEKLGETAATEFLAGKTGGG